MPSAQLSQMGFTDAHLATASGPLGLDLPGLLSSLQGKSAAFIAMIQGILAWAQAHPEVVQEAIAVLRLLGVMPK